MEPSGRNQWQPVANAVTPKPFKQANPQPVATHGNRSGAHGKEGVDGSSPSEGSAKAPHFGAFSFSSTCSSSNVRWVRSSFMELSSRRPRRKAIWESGESRYSRYRRAEVPLRKQAVGEAISCGRSRELRD
jgi:hypothetical protein